MQITQLENENVYTVSRLNKEVHVLLEETFTHIWVEGEISNFAAPHSGHWYFSLKDQAAQVRCAMFRGSQRKLNFIPKDGLHVLIKARVSLYENRGEFQLNVEFMEERGEGKLRRAYEALKKKLEAAGLFNSDRKKPLPAFPTQIGIITSATGAALRDILTVLKRRQASVPIIIYPTLVQGELAAANIVNAIQIANHRKECDVLILARGGGSLEDLWPFNEEIVAHAIYASAIPIVSGVGHEVDFTIADFVCDQRAPTPSAAAEIATSDGSELLQILARYKQQVERLIQRRTYDIKQKIIWVQKHLSQQHPKRRLLEKMQRLDFYELTFVQLQTRIINQLQSRIKDNNTKLHRFTPTLKIQHLQSDMSLHHQHLYNLLCTTIEKRKAMLANIGARLDGLSPLATLKRGYAIAMNKDQAILRDIHKIKVHDEIYVQLNQGSMTCVVEKITPSKEEAG